MSKGFYASLGASNMRKNRQFTVPYLLTGIFLVAMFYIIGALSVNPNLVASCGGSMQIVLDLAFKIVGIFSVIMLFYADSFLMKRRKKELGLYNILGMEKKHIGRTLLWETLYAWAIAFVGGVGCGLLFSKLVFMIAKLVFHMESKLDFYVSVEKLVVTAILFGVIYLMSFVFHLIQLKMNRPVELLKGGNVGEREPKTKWVMAVAGIGCIVVGYCMSLTIESPLAALSRFFVAVLFIIAGTYFTFTAGTIALLKMLRKNKTFYYKTTHFTAVSGLIYRMKQNAVGLSSICVLATAVLVLVSTTFSLYKGVEDAVDGKMLRNGLVEITASKDDLDQFSMDEIEQMAKEEGYEIWNRLDFYHSDLVVIKDGFSFDVDPEEIQNSNFNNVATLYLISAEDYKILTGKEVSLEKDHVLAYSSKGETFEKADVLGHDWTVDGQMDVTDLPIVEDVVATYGFVVPDMDTVWMISEEAAAKSAEGSENVTGGVTYSMYFDIPGDEAAQTDCVNKLYERVGDKIRTDAATGTVGYQVRGREEQFAKAYQLYGAFFFIGIFLAIVFMMGTVLIIYYKQMSEGFEDRERFLIMQKVGMSHREVRRSIRSQILIVFFLPLFTAAVHIAVVFPMIIKILSCFNMTNTSLFGICTVFTLIGFAVIYAIVYSLTAKVYYRIVTTKQS